MSAEPTQTTIIIEPDPLYRDAVRMLLHRVGSLAIALVESATTATAVLAATPVPLIITRYHLPDGRGAQLLTALKQAAPRAAVFVLTADPNVGEAAVAEGATGYLVTPMAADTLIALIQAYGGPRET
jgi:DNA-binding NarL/FixJ family response regulator